jgi:rhamnulose-1-phosphate aldolase
MKNDIVHSWFVQGMIRATTDMWQKGWDERNGGNVTLLLDEADVVSYVGDVSNPRANPLLRAEPDLAGRYFLVTGSGKYFRNVELAPGDNLGLIRINADGTGYDIVWGLPNGAVPTSELPAHLLSHAVRLQATNGRNRVVMHCHATNLISLTYVLPHRAEVFTRELWEMSTECLVVFPEGVGLLPWMVPGTQEIGEATAAQMRRHALVLWPFHGIFGTGATLDEAFGLIDTAEKAAEILVKVISMGGRKHQFTREQLIALAERFKVKPMEEALY